MKYWLFLSTLLLWSLCVRAQNCSCSGQSNLKVATFDLYLEESAPNKAARLDSAIQLIQNSDFDVICLQEVYTPSDRDLLINSVNSTFNHTFFDGTPRPNTCTADCTVAEMSDWTVCGSKEECLFKELNTAAITCMNDHCDTTQSSFSSNCHDCLKKAKVVSVWAQFDVCGGGFTNKDLDSKTNLKDSCQFLNGGQNGLLLLSKYPFVKTDSQLLQPSPINSYAVLYGQIDHPKLGNVDLFCTQLVGEFPWESFKNENQHQADQVLNFVDSKTSNNNDSVVVLMGNFATSDSFNNNDHSDNANDNQQSWQDIHDAGFVDTQRLFVDEQNIDQPCTWCSDNPIRPTTSNKDFVHDYVWVNDQARVCIEDSRRFADSNSAVSTSQGSSPISDHYGVWTAFCKSDQTLPNTSGTVSSISAYSAIVSLGLISVLAMLL